MSVVIKGMRMPENCASCPFAERIPPGRTRCLLTCRFLAENYEAPSKLMRNEHCPIEERKTGKWIEDAETFYKAVNEKGGGVDENTPYFTKDCIACSECLTMFSVIDNCTEDFDFCPKCGAKMNGGKQNETT